MSKSQVLLSQQAAQGNQLSTEKDLAARDLIRSRIVFRVSTCGIAKEAFFGNCIAGPKLQDGNPCADKSKGLCQPPQVRSGRTQLGRRGEQSPNAG